MSMKLIKIELFLSFKLGTGLAVGTVFSLVLFRRRAWPVVFGLGSGFGFATNDLNHDLNDSKLEN